MLHDVLIKEKNNSLQRWEGQLGGGAKVTLDGDIKSHKTEKAFMVSFLVTFIHTFRKW